MRVTDLCSIKGRGRAACVSHLPEGLAEGMIVRQGDNRWLVTGIGHYALPRKNIVEHGWGAELVIRPLDNGPADPTIGGTLIRDVT